MTAANPVLNWDAWRAGYDTATVGFQREFYDAVFVAHPHQHRFDAKTLGGLLDYIGRDVTVVELGGWTGDFAAAMLAARAEITWWENHEISPAALAASVCSDPRYVPVAAIDWYWTVTHTADVFVASHVLEHLTLRDVRQVLDASDVGFAFVQAPLGDSGRSWRGYAGSHILEVGWAGLEDELSVRGFRLLPALSREKVRCYERLPA